MLKIYSTEFLRKRGFSCRWLLTAKGLPVIELDLKNSKLLLDERTWKAITLPKLYFHIINKKFDIPLEDNSWQIIPQKNKT